MHRRLTTALLAVVPMLVPLLVSCGSDDGDSSGSAAPTGKPPGTPITADLTVPPGTVLAGVPFPYAAAEDGPIEGTEALLLVTGDPIEAFADLVEQVREAGPDPLTYHPDEDAEPAACTVADATLQCETHAFGPDGYRLDLALTVSEDPEPYLSHIRITEAEHSLSSPLPDLEVPVPTPEGESPVAPPDFPGELPGPGDPIGAPFAPSGEEHRLLDGYELLAPPIPPTCATGGFVAVVRATDGQRPRDAVAAWVVQLGTESFAGAPSVDSDVSTTHDGVEVVRVVLSGAGAGTATVTVAGEHVLLDRCND